MFMGPRHWFQGMNSASLCSLAGRYENPIPPRCLAPIDFLKIPALKPPFLNLPESISIATLPPFGPIEGQKWFDHISSQWEYQKNRFAFISFGKIQFFLPPCIWNLPFMSYRLRLRLLKTSVFMMYSNSWVSRLRWLKMESSAYTHPGPFYVPSSKYPSWLANRTKKGLNRKLQ